MKKKKDESTHLQNKKESEINNHQNRKRTNPYTHKSHFGDVYTKKSDNLWNKTVFLGNTIYPILSH